MRRRPFCKSTYFAFRGALPVVSELSTRLTVICASFFTQRVIAPNSDLGELT
jgi:hypothetical protein